MNDHPFVPADFAVPEELAGEGFRLEPLRARHNVADYAAWTSSVEHIRATPGFVGGRWPHEMSEAGNLADLERHAADFAARRGFTYTVLDAADEVVGCLYVYPPREGEPGDAAVRSWVRADHADLDPVLHEAVTAWLAREWPFRDPRYAPRVSPR
ncbi:twin-arginine translocation pathway signal protein [Actinomadura hibisca]|uniref:twin-arginine translocation pathway signal protein n=1 Tax=Actinomadura hibisca TaxID=68565 RepID=UPI00082E4D2F|nr:twin-arginine translocation pathway signal protein [Actinomadura hibisca]